MLAPARLRPVASSTAVEPLRTPCLDVLAGRSCATSLSCSSYARPLQVGQVHDPDDRAPAGVDRVALQAADLARLALLRDADADLLAQHFGRARARAGAAERIRVEDGARRAAQVALGDAADEARHVDAGRAGLRAGRVVAVE